MKTRFIYLAALLFTVLPHPAFADSSTAIGQSSASLSFGIPAWLEHFHMSYFTFFDGPGLDAGMHDYSPNVLGKPSDDGLRLKNLVSLKFDLNSSLALDFQMNIQCVLNNAKDVSDFNMLRWQAPRFGISGKLLSGKDWRLIGAANTDLPYFIPTGGVNATYRTTIFNPGLFAKFAYTPSGTRWSIFSLVMPRFYLYADRHAAEPQLTRAGFAPELKNEFVLAFDPSVNYALTSRTGLRFGTVFEYSKLVLSSWNPFNASLQVSSTKTDAWRLAALPLQLGVTHELSSAFNVSAFIQAYPIAAQRIRNDGSQASLYQTTSVGMWISGNLI